MTASSLSLVWSRSASNPGIVSWRSLFFGYFAGMIAITSILVVALRNPVYSALSLLVMFFHVAGLFITLHAEFLAAVQTHRLCRSYSGAVSVRRHDTQRHARRPLP